MLEICFEFIGAPACVQKHFTEFGVGVLLGDLSGDAVMIHGDLDCPLACDFNDFCFHNVCDF